MAELSLKTCSEDEKKLNTEGVFKTKSAKSLDF
jgi:hypothetical protein